MIYHSHIAAFTLSCFAIANDADAKVRTSRSTTYYKISGHYEDELKQQIRKLGPYNKRKKRQFTAQTNSHDYKVPPPKANDPGRYPNMLRGASRVLRHSGSAALLAATPAAACSPLKISTTQTRQVHEALVRALGLTEVKCDSEFLPLPTNIGCAERRGDTYGLTLLQTLFDNAGLPEEAPILTVGIRWYLPRRMTIDWRQEKKTIPDSIVEHVTTVIMPGDKNINSEFKTLMRKHHWSRVYQHCAGQGDSANKQVQLIFSVTLAKN